MWRYQESDQELAAGLFPGVETVAAARQPFARPLKDMGIQKSPARLILLKGCKIATRGYAVRIVCFFLSMGSGTALLLALVARLHLGFLLASFGLFLLSTYWLLWMHLTSNVRKTVKAIAISGTIAGLGATVAYDLWRFALVKLAGFPINPFEALPLFGYLIVGQGVSRYIAFSVGFIYHYVNGISFAVGYSFLLGRRNWTFAIAWALFLEALMFTVYPGWLNLNGVKEFTIMSTSGHIVYGIALGLTVRYQARSQRGT